MFCWKFSFFWRNKRRRRRRRKWIGSYRYITYRFIHMCLIIDEFVLKLKLEILDIRHCISYTPPPFLKDPHLCCKKKKKSWKIFMQKSVSKERQKKAALMGFHFKLTNWQILKCFFFFFFLLYICLFHLVIVL